ncbi:MAG: Mut7-C RNAse domain-containing protein, partial [Candidatus Hodarchaeales archaeon]
MKMKFLLDGMLGSLCRWLRIIGYDSIYRRDYLDDDLIEEAKRTNRILLTRDRDLVTRAKKRDISSCYLDAFTNEEMLKFLVENLNLVIKSSDSRCPKCNYLLNKTEKTEIKSRVPKNTYENFDEFWICCDCGNVYWRGSHWDNISKTLKNARV